MKIDILFKKRNQRVSLFCTVYYFERNNIIAHWFCRDENKKNKIIFEKRLDLSPCETFMLTTNKDVINTNFRRRNLYDEEK